MKKVIVGALIAVAGLSSVVHIAQAAETENRTATIAPCGNASKDEIAALVKRDFLQNRITRWDADKKLLGTSTPVVWITPASITGDNAKWIVPVKVRGNNTDKTYPVTLNCQLGEITYGNPQ
ncbi:protein YebF [Hafnia psychrotolerans]|uniref:Protein YebF n=1 Tax=Hafnia psychrotolerans TaxID=1477018 RepID=A0ABQ1GCL5_9GAMM|nr:protein YebF [Hafnia psychrotolerans]GGA41084.1 hypothetical protein GCM10011328_15030 [Hafnia psychrotolerans]